MPRRLLSDAGLMSYDRTKSLGVEVFWHSGTDVRRLE